MIPSSTQLQTTLAPIIAFLAGLLAGKGVFGWDAETWMTILGGVVGVIGTIWAAVATRPSAVVASAVAGDKATMVAAVADLDEVKHIDLNKTMPETKAIEAATPPNVTAS